MSDVDPREYYNSAAHFYNKRVLVTGASGFLGKTVCEHLRAGGAHLFFPPRNQLSLLDYSSVVRYLSMHRPAYGYSAFDYIFHLAGRVGGIREVSLHPYLFISENIAMASNLLEALVRANDFATKVIFAGSVCAYPLNTPIPMMEKDLWNGKPEPTNGPYGVAKRTIQTLAEAATSEHSIPTVYALLANMYGPGDKYDPNLSHVIPATIMKMHLAKHRKERVVEMWGSGSPTRDFLYVNDAASALLELAVHINDPRPINVGSGAETSIRQVAELVAEYIGYDGEILWNTSKPDGQPRRLLDLTVIETLLGWKPVTPFRSGIHQTIDDYMKRFGRYVELH